MLLNRILFNTVCSAMFIELCKVVFTDYNIVKELMEKTRTETGLKVKVRFNLKKYKTEIKVKKENVEYHRIQFNQNSPKLSYRISA